MQPPKVELDLEKIASFRKSRRAALGATLGIAGCLVYWLYLYLLFYGPTPKLVISPETTLITEPLAADGLPHYGRSFLSATQDGATPENNAAIPFWQAMGSQIIEPEDRERLFAELGCPVPSDTTGLEDLSDSTVYGRLFAEIAPESIRDNEAAFEEWAKELVDLCMAQRLTPEVANELVRWSEKNKLQLALLREGMKRSHYHNPSPQFLLDDSFPIFHSLVPGLEAIRSATRSLAVSASLHTFQGNQQAAMEDLKAIFRAAQHLKKSPFFVAHIISSGMTYFGKNGSARWIEVVDDPQLLQSYLQFLQQHPEPNGLQNAMKYETLSGLDIVMRACSKVRARAPLDLSDDYDPTKRSVDVNVALRTYLHWANRSNEALLIEDRISRLKAAQKFANDFDTYIAARTNSPWKYIAPRWTAAAYSEQVSLIYVIRLLPSIDGIMIAEDRSVAQQRMTRIAIRLKLYKLAEGEYPSSLRSLRGEAIPLDPFTNQPFHYERKGNGFQLVSLGTGGISYQADNYSLELPVPTINLAELN